MRGGEDRKERSAKEKRVKEAHLGPLSEEKKNNFLVTDGISSSVMQMEQPVRQDMQFYYVVSLCVCVRVHAHVCVSVCVRATLSTKSSALHRE